MHGNAGNAVPLLEPRQHRHASRAARFDCKPGAYRALLLPQRSRTPLANSLALSLSLSSLRYPQQTLLLESRNSSILEFAGAALSNLTAAGGADCGSVEADAENCGAAQENAGPVNASSAGGEPAKTKKKKTKKKKKKKKKKQSIVLNVEGISDPHVCTAVERCLIMAAGVVSVTLETSRGNAIVVARADTTPGDLVTALEDLGLVASIFDQKASTPQGSKPANTLHYLDDEYKAEDHKGAFRFVRFATAPQHIRLTHVPLSLSLSHTHTHTHTHTAQRR